MIEEKRFRQLCRSEYGGFEGARFAEALVQQPGSDPVKILFSIGWNKTSEVTISRADSEQYAKWAAEEAAPERELLEHIKPMMRDWVLRNRASMCGRLRAAMEKYVPDRGGVQIIWEIATPDVVPYEAAQRYIQKYGGAQ